MNLILVTFFLIGFGRLESIEGNGEILLTDPKSISLSGSDLAETFTGYRFLKNPASLPFLKGIEFFVSSNWTGHSEVRSKLAYDPFDNTVGEAVVYSRSYDFLNLGASGISYSNGKIGVALSFSPRYDLTYLYHRIERLDAYTISEEEKREERGSVNDYSLHLSYRPVNKISFGVTISYLSGDLQKYSYLYTPPDVDYSYDTLNFSGMGGNLGFIFKPSLNFTFSLLYRFRTHLSGNGEIKYPSEFGLSFVLEPPSKLPTKVYFSYVYIPWNKVEDRFEEVNDFRIGFEHSFLPTSTLMLGARLSESYTRKRLWIPSFSAGWSNSLYKNYSITFGVLLKPLNYSLYEGGDKFTVRENLTHFSLGLTGKF
jgi:hypothetical protein